MEIEYEKQIETEKSNLEYKNNNSEKNPIPFESLKISTINSIVRLNTKINIDKLFYLLEVIPPEQIVKKKKMKTTFPGIIISANYKNVVRGASFSSKSFPNSIIIYVNTKKKIINLKLCKETFQICGVTSEEMIIETVEIIIKHIFYIQKILEIIKNNPIETQKTLDWIALKILGKELNVIEKTNILSNDFENEKIEKINSIIIPKEYPDDFPEDINKYLARYFIRLSTDFFNYKLFIEKLNNIVKNLDYNIIKENLNISNISYAKINYNYKLNFEINRQKIYEIFSNNDNFSAEYNNTVNHHVSVNLSFEISEDLKDKISRKPQKLHHTFLIYRSGCITQSSPCTELAKIAYEKFMKIITDNKKTIFKS
uniref:Transcription factor TFIID n=1 Tax=Pithovirus LCPAC104 TaxID=2506589 RepID=A0A481Z3V8_9VIRU|nr:MAG: transcription factor TFIID [Pithovirus LCPAC104]